MNYHKGDLVWAAYQYSGTEISIEMIEIETVNFDGAFPYRGEYTIMELYEILGYV